MIGFVMLCGIIVNNGIVLVDYINQLRLEGMEKRKAIIEAGTTRMRPILMTTLTTILAMLPTCFATGPAAMLRGMSVVMIGALIAFTALIPVAGAYIGAAVGAFMILMVSPMQALIFLIFLVILQQLEGNLIYPKVVGSSLGLPGIWVLAAVVLGGGVMGVLGMLLGGALATVIMLLLGTGVG
jgi:predicted PurR-regulated permease PerM